KLSPVLTPFRFRPRCHRRFHCCFYSSCPAHHDPPASPTRRSSDLQSCGGLLSAADRFSGDRREQVLQGLGLAAGVELFGHEVSGDRKSTRLNSSPWPSRMPSTARNKKLPITDHHKYTDCYA